MGDVPHPPPDSPDADLVKRLHSGDVAAFEEVLRTHAGRLLSVARRFLDNEEDARDAVQDACLSAFRALGSFDGHASLGTWLHRIVVNACLTRLRTQRRHPEQSLDDLLPTFHDDGHPTRPATPWREPSSDQLALEAHEAVHVALARLPEDFRTVLLLRDIEELDTEETAQLLGISPGAAKTRLHRARQALRTLLEPQFRREES